MNDFDSPFLDSDIEALEESIRLHPAKGFKVPRFTSACPGCGRPANPRMLEVPHYAPDSKPICSSCRKSFARWHRTPEQIAASKRAREARRAAGVKPSVGFAE